MDKDKVLWNILKEHIGHNVEIVYYGNKDNPTDICLECSDCNEVVLDAEIYTLCERDNEDVDTNAILDHLSETQKEQLADELIQELSPGYKDRLYRQLWMEYVKEDIKKHTEDLDSSLSDDEISKVASLYCECGKYDCTLPYWDNIDNLIQIVKGDASF